MDAKELNFYGHILASVLFPAALVFGGYLARWAMWVTLLVSFNTIKTTFGLPQIDQSTLSFSRWREALPPVQMWLGRVLHTTEVHFIMFNIIWLSLPLGSEVLVVPCFLRRAVWSACTTAARTHADSALWQRFQPAWQKLKEHEMPILTQCASFEIYLAVKCVLSLIFGAGLQAALMLYVHMTFLRMTYHGDASTPTKPAALHRQAWAALDERTAPVFRAVPFLGMPINMVKSWFMRVQ